MEDNWQELERAKKEKQEENERERLQRSASVYPDSIGARMEVTLEAQVIQEKIEPHSEKIAGLIEMWNPIVRELLSEIAAATWGNRIWKLSGKIIWSQDSQTPSLYWQALHSRTYYNAWYSVELRTDLEANAIRFIIYCKEASYTISADMTEEALKSALVDAFKLGPLDNIFHENFPGIPI
jgi:hypothetical protein